MHQQPAKPTSAAARSRNSAIGPIRPLGSSSTLFAQPSPEQLILTGQQELSELLVSMIEISKASYQVVEGEVVLVLGPTGAGKSTFINYLASKPFIQDPKDEDNVICTNPLVAVSHGQVSCTNWTTSRQHIYQHDRNLLFCDCPGYEDNRGTPTQIANAFGLRSVATNNHIKGIILLVDYYNLKSQRGHDCYQAIKKTLDFLGQNVLNEIDLNSVFVLFTKVPKNRVASFGRLIEEIFADEELRHGLLRPENVGVYNPRDEFQADALMHAGRSLVYNRESIISRAATFRGIRNAEGMFNIILDEAAKLRVYEMAGAVNFEIRAALQHKAFHPALQLMGFMYEFSRLKITEVEKEIVKLETLLIDWVKSFKSAGPEALEILSDFVDTVETELEHNEEIKVTLHETVAETVQDLKARFEKERKSIEELQAAREAQEKANQDVHRLEGAQADLKTSLEQSKITQREYEAKNNVLQRQVLETKQEMQAHGEKMDKLNTELTRARENLLKQQEDFNRQQQEKDRQTADRISKLEGELREAARAASSQPQIQILPPWLFPGMMGGMMGGGMMPGMMGGGMDPGMMGEMGGGMPRRGLQANVMSGIGEVSQAKRGPGRPPGSKDSYPRVRTCFKKG